MTFGGHDTAKKQGSINRRALLVAGMQAGIVGILGLRMRYLQVVQADKFRMLADENRINISLLPPARGLIIERNGVVLAENQQNYRIVIVREQAGDARAVLARLSDIVPLSPDKREGLLKDIARRPAFVPVTVAEHVSWQQVSEVSVNAPSLPGISAEVGLSRDYPMAKDFAHIVGYVGPVSDYDLNRLDDKDPLLQIPKFQIGKSGVEAKVERNLRGFAGSRRIEVNSVGRVMRELDRNEGKPGANVELTCDYHLQNYLMARLKEQSASAVVIDVRSGELVAIGSSPGFDPNKFVKGISTKDYKALLDNPFNPLSNKTVQGAYPPGSTFKTMVGLAALEAGLVTPDEIVVCRGFITVGKQRFHCWKRSGHGRVNFRDSLKHSCDVYYYEMAQRVGIEKISAMARRFGLGERINLPLNGVTGGLMPTKAWKRKVIGEAWRIGDTLNAAIGQGFVLTTPLQLATMAARLATGKKVVPHLIRAIDGVRTIVLPPEDIGVSQASLDAVHGGMFAVSNERGATAYSKRIAEKTMRLAGKTGTSQVRRITKKERAHGVIRNADLPWKRRDHALFIAFAPFDAPRYAISVVIEHGGGGWQL